MNSDKNNKNKNSNNNDNISKTRKKQPSKAGGVVKTIFYVNYKILSVIIMIILTLLIIGIITGGIVAGAFALYVKNNIDPTIEGLAAMSSESDLTTTIYYYEHEDSFNRIDIRTFDDKDTHWKVYDTLYGLQNRSWVKYSKMPQNLIDAFVALEDKRFFEHKGVDWLRTVDVAVDYFLGSGVAGASTITQQLIKNRTGEDDVRIQRKIQEILRAVYLETITSKEDILETYLNIVNLSSRCYGVQAAADKFFNKDVSELNLIECAAIASIVQSPTAFNPIVRPENNKKRRDACLKNMLDQEKITQEEFDGAYDKELVLSLTENTYVETVNSYYLDQIMEDIIADLYEQYGYTRNMASHLLFSGGLKIYSCMDWEIQDIMEYVYERDEYFPEQAKGALKMESAMVVMDPYSGELKGIVGGRSDKVQRGLNRASQSKRPPGSAIKPVSVYAPALHLGLINYGTPMDDSPAMVISDKNGSKRLWPTNLPLGYEGHVTLSRAVAVSKNTTAVRTLQKMTPGISFRFLRDELNLSVIEQYVLANGAILSDIDISPLSLGGMTKGLSVYELTAAYQIFVNKGIYSKPRSYYRVTDQAGNIILDNQAEKKMVISEEAAAIMTKLLMGVVTEGTASGLVMKDRIEVAGKTGTTNDNYDRWFVGYTPYYVCGVWFGYDQPKYMNVSSGRGNPPMLLFNYVMDTIHLPIYENPKKFEVPLNIITAEYCRDSGMLYGPDCALDPRGDRMMSGYFARGTEPSEPCNVHVVVDWCTEYKAVAGPGCPEDKVIKTALIRNYSREYPNTIGNPYLPDAEYTYRDVEYDYVYPTSTWQPFYINVMPAGTNPGYSVSYGQRPYNSFCVEHNITMTWPYDLRPVSEPVTEPATEPLTELETEFVEETTSNEELTPPQTTTLVPTPNISTEEPTITTEPTSEIEELLTTEPVVEHTETAEITESDEE